MKLTRAQQQAIDQRGGNLLLSASAGSGKTEVLARRCLGLIADPQRPCGVDRLLVVTFTRAAAAELRVRIARMLREQAVAAATPELRGHLQRQERLVDAADIGTIDAWCGRIIREHYAETGIDVGFRVLGEQEAPLLRSRVLDALFDWVHRSTEPPAPAARAWMARATTPEDRFLRDLVQDLNRYREHLVNPTCWLREQKAACQRDDGPRVLATAIREECLFQAKELEALQRMQSDAALAARCAAYLDALGAWQKELEAAASANSGAGVKAVVRKMAAFKWRKPRGAAEPALARLIGERWLEKRLQGAWTPGHVNVALAHAGELGGLLTTLLELEEKYERALQAAKRAQSAYEFSDVLRITLDLLGTPHGPQSRVPTDVARRLQSRYEHVLVDEYQDTSPVQVEILRLVTRPAPGNSFLVGDIKQSIYGFRQAEPRLFGQMIEDFACGRAAGSVQNLSDNFRSHAEVLKPLNAMFERLFDPRLGGTTYGPDERLVPGREATEPPNPTLDAAPRVAVHFIEKPDGSAARTEEEELDSLEREAQLAANEIRAMLERGVQIPERSSDGQIRLRPLRLSDVVILLRAAKENAARVTGVLRKNGLDCVTQGPERLLSAVETRDLVNVLRLLVNRRQDVALAAYLRGPMVGLCPADLLHIRRACPAGDLLDAVERYRRSRETESVAAQLDAAMSRLDTWRRRSVEEDLPGLLRQIVQETGLEFFAAGLRDGAQRAALLRTVRDLAASFRAGGGGMAEFLAHLDGLAEADLEPPAQGADAAEAIRVMTIHAAKGLEYPVVFLLGAGAAFNRRSQARALLCDPDIGVGMRFDDYSLRTELCAARYLVLRQRVAARELEEELRLVYVAATRARECLVMVGTGKAGDLDAVHALRSGCDRPPLIARLSAASRLEWILLACPALGGGAEAGRIALARHAAEDIRLPAMNGEADTLTQASAGVSPAGEEGVAAKGCVETSDASAPPGTWTAADEAWFERGRHLLAVDVGSVWDRFPALITVSTAKAAVFGPPEGEEQAHCLEEEVELPGPAFAASPAGDGGRAVGTACHRFLQFADLDRLTTEAQVREQAAGLVSLARLAQDEAALLPLGDLAWFGRSPAGRLLAAAGPAVRREMPFVHALPVAEAERLLLRGVIDVVVDTPAGLVLLDYKTDMVSGAEELQRRVRGYGVQAQLYARAAASILGRPVARCALVFLRMREVLDVDLRADDFPAVVRSLGGSGAG